MKKLIVSLLFIFILSACSKETVEVSLNPGYDIVSVNTSWDDEGCSLVIDSSEVVPMDTPTQQVDITTLGEYSIVYNKEYGGKDYTCQRIVKVIDDIAPIVTLNGGIDTIFVGEEWIDMGVTAIDNIAGDLVYTTSGTVDSEVTGTYEITYTVTDQFLNETVVKRIITVTTNN